MSDREAFKSKQSPLFGSSDTLVGKKVDRFEILAQLGEGSLSAVYRAQDTESGHQVVLKIIHKHLLTSIKNLKRFEQKMRTLMSLADRRICNYSDVVFSEGKVILVTEPLVYESLEDLLSKTGHIGPERAVGIFTQVCEALDAAYKQDVMHRDLKPSNIGILDNQQFSDDVVVFDFGLAKIIAEESSEHKTEQYITRTRETFGSPLYLSPEQCGGKKIDNRSDIYSLGCVIYESLTGKPPFVGKNVLETAYKHMNDVQRPLGLDPSLEPISTRFEEVVSKCLAKDPDNRYQTPDELKNDLDLIMSATDSEWTNSAYVYKEAVVKKRKKTKKKAGASRFSTEALVWSIGILSICGVVGFWSWIILKPENKKNYTFDNNAIWNVRLSAKPAQVEDFGNKEEAAKVNLQSIERDIGPNCREYADALLALVQLYHESQHWHDALTYGKKLTACTIRLEKDGQDGPGPLSDCYRLVAYAAFCAGENDEAIPAAEKSLELAAGKQSLNLSNIQCLRILGDIYSKQNNLAKATEMFKRFYNCSELEKEQHPNVYWDACAKLGDIYRRQGKFADAERYYKMGLDWWRSHGNPETVWAPKALYGYGLTLYEAGRYKEAEEPLKEDRTMVRHSAQVDPGLKAAVKKLYIDSLYHTNWFNALSAQLNDSDKE